jgi:type IV secretion system protein VirB10
MPLAGPGSSPDPRTLAPAPADEGVTPLVALPRQGLPNWAVIAMIAAAAIVLFLVLNSRRQAVTTTAETAPRPGIAGQSPAPAPPLVLPPTIVQPQPPFQIQPQPQIVFPQAQTAPAPRFVAPPQPSRPQVVYVPQTQPQPVPQIQPSSPPRVAAEQALVIDNTTAQGSEAAAGPAGDAAAGGGATAVAGTRSRAGVLANRTTTVPQGTLIPAVMETAFNSTRPGLARAIVSRDVRGFDGTRVLIPRGSRLVGEYRADTQPGQRRALVTWIRLIRPDGVTIAIASPSTDTLGRGGIRANVNNHFFERFAGSILRSAVDVGVTLAAGAANAPVVLVPGSSGVSSAAPQPEIRPTLTVRAGTSISVFVARDLDFTGVERRR